MVQPPNFAITLAAQDLAALAGNLIGWILATLQHHTGKGAEFTDRFAVDMNTKPPGQPSGHHPFDLLCANHKIEHRLTRPYRPQTNGLVERFNRRIAEAIGREPKRGSARRTFPCQADRDAFLNRFVADYNRTRLKGLGYVAPPDALANLPRPNTLARSPAPASREACRRAHKEKRPAREAVGLIKIWTGARTKIVTTHLSHQNSLFKSIGYREGGRSGRAR